MLFHLLSLYHDKLSNVTVNNEYVNRFLLIILKGLLRAHKLPDVFLTHETIHYFVELRSIKGKLSWNDSVLLCETFFTCSSKKRQNPVPSFHPSLNFMLPTSVLGTTGAMTGSLNFSSLPHYP